MLTVLYEVKIICGQSLTKVSILCYHCPMIEHSVFHMMISFQGTLGITNEKRIDDERKEENNFTDSEYLSLKSDGPFGRLANREFNLI